MVGFSKMLVYFRNRHCRREQALYQCRPERMINARPCFLRRTLGFKISEDEKGVNQSYAL
jgi:hypothetical protein